MSEKENMELNIKDFKYSFNKYHKTYNIEILEDGRWRRLTLNEDAFKTSIRINYRNKENTRNKPYKPYFYFILKWKYMFISDFFKKESTKKNMSFWSGTLTPIIAVIIALVSVMDNRIERKDSIENIERGRLKIQELNKVESNKLKIQIQILSDKLDSVHFLHSENIRVLKNKIEKKK